MGHLIDDLLSFSRTGRAQMRIEPVALGPLVDECRRELEPEAKGRQIEWVIGELPEVAADRSLLRQVLANLLTNARVHTPAGTRVTVRLAAEAGGVLLTVADDGPGIDPSLLGRVFDRFARGESGRAVARAEGSASSGLGLAIVKAIVDAHGGEISVESTAAGTAFTIRLPRA